MKDKKELTRSIKASETCIASYRNDLKLSEACIAGHQEDLDKAKEELTALEKPELRPLEEFEVQDRFTADNDRIHIKLKDDNKAIMVNYWFGSDNHPTEFELESFETICKKGLRVVATAKQKENEK